MVENVEQAVHMLIAVEERLPLNAPLSLQYDAVVPREPAARTQTNWHHSVCAYRMLSPATVGF